MLPMPLFREWLCGPTNTSRQPWLEWAPTMTEERSVKQNGRELPKTGNVFRSGNRVPSQSVRVCASYSAAGLRVRGHRDYGPARSLQHVPTAMNRDSQDTPEVRGERIDSA